MGGRGSGRKGWRAVIERQRRIDVRDLKGSGSGTWRWTRGGEEIGSVSYTVAPDAMTLIYAADGELQRVELQLTRLPCRFGGTRLYVHCPRCSRRVEVVVLAGGRIWGCRRCLRLGYTSQGLWVGDRCERRADKLRERVAIDDGERLRKRKWLRWRTFRRVCEQADQLQEVADSAFVDRALRLFG